MIRNTTLCYIEQDGKYLMLHRVKKKNDINHDKWIGIGGKFEFQESPEDCLLREALEETGLTLTAWRYRGIVTFISGPGDDAEYMHLFTAHGFHGELKVCDEGDLEWIEKSRLRELTLWEGDKLFLELLEQDAPFFSLKLVYEGDTLKQAVLDGQVLENFRLPAPKKEKEPLLISACLMGIPCRYDGKKKEYPELQALQDRYTLIPVCPEQLGGLATPRTPAERQNGLVVTAEGKDVTAQYSAGAEAVLQLAKALGCRKALLKERSPSCGSREIYDGTFSRRLIPGMGITAELLTENELTVYGESHWEELL